MPDPPTLLAKPFRHPTLDLLLLDQFTAAGGVKATTDRLLNVDAVLDILERRFFRERVE